MNILVVGTGYVGLVTGACMAEMGHHVICLDIDDEKIQLLNSGKLPIYEPGLSEIVDRGVKTKRLKFSTDYQKSVTESNICFITVDTPLANDGFADRSAIKNACISIAEYMNDYKLIVIKSTVPIGTADFVKETIDQVLSRKNIHVSYDIVSNPEFLKEGDAVNDCMKPDRIIIGAETEKARNLMKEIYAPFMFNHEKIIFMDIPSAELSKYAANLMLACRISFMNEMASICEATGANIDHLRHGIGMDPRIGTHFLYAGVGFGGSCFPKDVYALTSQAEALNCDVSLLKSIYDVNVKQKKLMAKKMRKYFEGKGGLQDKTFGILGLSFKPDTDDIRESSSLVLIQDLLEEGAHLRLYDPVAMDNAKQVLKENSNIYWATNEYDTANDADALVLMTEWKQFRLLNFDEIIPKMKGHVFFDGRNQYNPEKMNRFGFDYISIGKKPYLLGEKERIKTS